MTLAKDYWPKKNIEMWFLILPRCWICEFERLWGGVVVLSFCTSPLGAYWDNGDVDGIIWCWCCNTLLLPDTTVDAEDWLVDSSLNGTPIVANRKMQKKSFNQSTFQMKIYSKNVGDHLPIFKMWVPNGTVLRRMSASAGIIRAGLHVVRTGTVCWHWMASMVARLLFT